MSDRCWPYRAGGADRLRPAALPQEAVSCVISGKLSADDPKDTVKLKTVGAGIAIGTAVGAGIGVAMGNLGAGIAIGIAIGAAVGASRQRKGE